MLSQSIKSIIPPVLFKKIKSVYYDQKLKQARSAFQSAGKLPSFLDKNQFLELHNRYTSNTNVSYEPEALLVRGEARANELKTLLGNNFAEIKSCVEIGCGDGMVCSVLTAHGINATAIDFDDSLFDTRAKENGVKFLVSDASNLPLPSSSFDLVFSYNSFEHIMDPEKAFRESLRLLNPGGFLYLTFNPLFFAPMGFHAYKSTQVPYLQVLFTESDIKQLVVENNLPDITFSFTALNKWSISQFRSLWEKFKNDFNIVHYREVPDYYGLELIKQFPSCFKSKSECLDDFIVSGIEILIRKAK